MNDEQNTPLGEGGGADTSEAPGVPKEPASSPENGKKPGKKKRALLIVGILLLILGLPALLGLHYLNLWRSGDWQPSPELKEMLKSLVESTELMEDARALKADIKGLADAVRSQDSAAAGQARERMRQDLRDIEDDLSSPLIAAAGIAPGLGDEIRTVRELIRILEEADETLIGPYLALMERCPLSGMSTENGLRVDVLLQYLDLLEQIQPEASALFERFNALDLHLFDEDGKIAGYAAQMESLLDAGDGTRSALPALRVLLGGGEDRLYLFAAQNSSEIRASGGFPGSVGTIRIRDGLMSISEFQSVYQMFSMSTRTAISPVEDKIFSGRMHLSWDSDFSPDFERVAFIWAEAYYFRHGETVDGVISGTPAIIQRLLSFLGSVQLSDGTVLNGENASHVLGYDLYFRYLGADQTYGATDYVDELFAESARKTLDLLFSRLDVKLLADYYSFFRTSVADRTLMVWLADEEEQALIREAGWNAGLNRDPARPQAGIFFNSTSASKMAWFLNIDPVLSEPVEQEDGSRVYELSVRFSNVMTEEELRRAGQYILGGDGGGITGSVYLFAPAGGSISELEASNGWWVYTETYEGLALGYLIDVTIYPSEPLVLRCRITTAPEAEAPMGLIVTPTMQAYR